MFTIIILSIILMLTASQLTRVKSNIFGLNNCAILIYALLVAFRGESGSDTFLYKSLFDLPIYFITFPEPGLVLLFDIFNALGLTFDHILLLQGIMVFASLRLMSKKQGPLMVALYIVLFGLNVDMSTLRQSFATHFLIICIMGFNARWIASLAIAIHFSSLFSFLTNLKNKKIYIYLILVSPIIFSYINRYMEQSPDSLGRDSLSWIPQLIFVIVFLWLQGLSALWLLISSFLLYIPVGYRVLSYVIPFTSQKRVQRWRHYAASFLLFLFAIVKVDSYCEQSKANDGNKSVVTHYEELL